MPTVVDDGSIADAYGLSGFPFWTFVDADGNVVGRASGQLGVDVLSQWGERLAD